MRTEELIGRLADNAAPVRPLPPPCLRVVSWLVIAVPVVAMVVAAMSPRPDLMEKITDSRYLTEQGAAVATALTAAFAALSATVPGRSRRMSLLPLAPLALWLGSLGQGCISGWLDAGTAELIFEPDWQCIPVIAMTGAIPAAAMTVMLRRGAPLHPRLAVALGALAAAALANVGLRLFHPQDASLMVLAWQFGTVAALTALSGCCARRLLRWRHLTAA